MAREAKDNDPQDDDLLRAVAQAVRGLQFGQVQITVHDSRIVRIEKTERVRFGASDAPTAAPRGGEQR